MNKRVISMILSAAIVATVCTGFATTASAAAKTPQYQTQARQMEELNRGLVATFLGTYDGKGVYLSWRLLGKESLENQAFDIYRGNTKIGKSTEPTTGEHDPTCYIDKIGKKTDKYRVVPAGTPKEEALKAPTQMTGTMTNYTNSGGSLTNSFTYIDIPISRPADVKRMGDGKTSHYYNVDKDHDGGANDASVGDLDGDGDYEIVLKWDPTDSKDSAGADYTGNVFIDAYEIDPNNTPDENGNLYKWRIDLGKNVTAGAHYTQFLVYDFDGDGRAEVVMKTAPGSIDGQGHYVSEVGDTDAIRNVDNTKAFIGTSSRLKGKNPFTQYLTVFDGETGAALYTTEFIPYETAENAYWGDGSAKYNRSERYLAAVAYLDGVHPSIVMVRGYYHDTVIRAYNWDGKELSAAKEPAKAGANYSQHIGKSSASSTTLYAQGNHNLSIGDIDNDGKDEIVFGSAALDDDLKTLLGNTKLGHGDAMHMSDFNNDGTQEVFSVKEEKYKTFAEDLRNPATGKQFWASGKITTSGDNGRGVMDNIDDNYAKTHSNALALGWSSGKDKTHDFNGNDVAAKPASAGNGSFDNFLVYWDGDLSRELLDANIIQKYDATNGYTTRFYGATDAYTLTGGSTNNYTKRNPSLVADIWGDWREEIIMSTGKGKDDTPALRIFTSTLPTDYRLTTLMHDCQYRLSVAWQNVAYNQPTHQSYYIGSVALATDSSGNALNYLAPATKYTKVKYPSDDWINVSDLQLDKTSLTVERAKTAAITATVLPDAATRKTVLWTSSDESVATVSNGNVRGVSRGTATITATTLDGGFKRECEVNVWSNDVDGVYITDLADNKMINLIVDDVTKVTAEVSPADASEKAVKWTSSNEAVATVSDSGLVTGISTGLATIYTTTVDGEYKDACVVNVVPQGLVGMNASDSFVTTSAEGDTTKFTLTPTSGIISHIDTGAAQGAEVHKDFEVPADGKVKLTFHFTTGGKQIDGSTWNWTGHEYNTALALLADDGSNILTAEQVWETKATDLWSTILDHEKTSLIPDNEETADWTTIEDGAGNVKGSAKRWIVTAEFDYDKDTCTIDIIGTDDTWIAKNAEYATTFALNGAKFKTLKCYTTNTGSGTIIAEPKIEEVAYGVPVPATGTTSNVYKRGTTTGTPWSQSDLSDWTQTGDIKLEYDAQNGRLWYNPTNPGASYSASKTFEGISDDASLMYNVDWTFGRSTARDANVEYIRFGSDFCVGYLGSSYKVVVSTDGGTTWGETALFTGSNAEFTKNIKLEIDPSSKKIKSFKFDGSEVAGYSNYSLPETATINSITFGFDRSGKVGDGYVVPTGLSNIVVSQFGEDITPQFTVQFASDDEILQTDRIDVGEMPSFKGENPSKAQDAKYTYTFKGWSPEITKAVDDVVYMAQYDMEPRTYTVTLNLNGGTVETDVTSYTYGTEVTLPVPEKDGYMFDGYYANAQFTGTAVTAISKTDTGDKTYYAKWKVIPKLTIGEIEGMNVPVSIVTAEDFESVQLIAALYDGDVVKEIKSVTVNDIKTDVTQTETFIFENNPADYTVKVFAWNSLEKMVPLTDKPTIKEKAE